MARRQHAIRRRDWAWIAEHQRVTRQIERGREVLGQRAHSAQLAEFACGRDAGELAELFAGRLDGNVSI